MKKKQHAPTQKDLLKLDIARKLGLEDKILQYGWAELTAQESGRIGGILSGKSRAQSAARRKGEHDAVYGALGDLRPMDAARPAPGGLDTGAAGPLV